jgi:hypothetical protein
MNKPVDATCRERQSARYVGRIFKVNAAPVKQPWMWTLAFAHHEDIPHTTTPRPRGRHDGIRKKWQQE